MSPDASRRLRAKLGEWFGRGTALREARAAVPGAGEAALAFQQAGLLRVVAAQVTAPVEPLPSGSRSGVLMRLYCDLVFWTLAAARTDEQGPALDFDTLWREAPEAKLLRAAGSEPNLEAVHQAFTRLSGRAALDATDADVARVRQFAEALYLDVAVPRQRVDRILRQRWMRWTGAGAAVVALLLVARAVAIGPNLAGDFKTSTTLPNCQADPGCAARMFHTEQESSPWVEFDLGKLRRVHLIEVKNRVDCCQDRGVPLVAEISNDRVVWKEIARQDKDYTTWKAKFRPVQARYLRLRVPRPSMLHLDDVVIR